jgi:tyrosine-specific transport protein
MEKEGNGKKAFFPAIATITGTAIGAGILGLPYVISKSGILPGILHLVILGLIMLLINLYLGEIVLRTKGHHQLPGYAQKYLGKTGKIIMLFSMVFGIYGALVAYLIGEGESLSFIFTGSLAYTLIFSIVFFAIMALLVYLGLEALKEGESVGFIAVLVIISIIIIYFLPKIRFENFIFLPSSPFLWLMPYGVVLFSLLSFSALPEVEQELARNEKLMKKAIVLGALIPIAIYLIFMLVVVGFAGKATPEIATFALGKLPTFLAVFTMFTAFFVLATAMKDMYAFDFKIKKTWAWFLACFVPFIIALIIIAFKIADFIKVIGVTGAITGGLTGILIILMARKAKKLGNRNPEYKIPFNWVIAIILILLFALGILYQFVF